MTHRAPIALLAMAMPLLLAGQQLPAHGHHPTYKVIDTGTLGGPDSGLGFDGARNINNRGVLAAGSDTATPTTPPFCGTDCFVSHATIWQDGRLTDLGTIPGPGGGTSWISDSGLVAGLAMNGLIDPLTGAPELKPVLWKDGGPIDLGTFGGTQGIAGSVNDRGQVVGCATNPAPDPNSLCMGTTQATQSRAFLWRDGTMKDLGTLGGPDANAIIVNDRGQVAGWSYMNAEPIGNCFGFPVTAHPFLWENGKMTDLGTFGGSCGLPNWLNSRGQIAGWASLDGDTMVHPFLWDRGSLKDLGTLGGDFGVVYSVSEAGDAAGWASTLPGPSGFPVHPFLWTHGEMQDLGLLAGKVCGEAFAVNSKQEVVGSADEDCNQGNSSAFLWDKGNLIDLNIFVPEGSGVQLAFGLSINESGEIAALGFLPNGDQHAFVLIPCGEGEQHGCDSSGEHAPAPAVRRSTPPVPNTMTAATVQHRLTPGANVAAWRRQRADRYRLPAAGTTSN